MLSRCRVAVLSRAQLCPGHHLVKLVEVYHLDQVEEFGFSIVQREESNSIVSILEYIYYN